MLSAELLRIRVLPGRYKPLWELPRVMEHLTCSRVDCVCESCSVSRLTHLSPPLALLWPQRYKGQP